MYLLMGDEPYYPDLVCNAVIEHSLDEFSRDFNETICYGADVDAETVITAARRFPMMAERQLVVVKDAQAMKDLEQLGLRVQHGIFGAHMHVCYENDGPVTIIADSADLFGK